MASSNGRGVRNKGSNYERDLAKHINAHLGCEMAFRAPLSGGGKVGMSGGADILGVPDLFIEAKRTERLNIRSALAQAERNIEKTRSPEAAVVITRRNREATGQSIVAMRLDDFLTIYASHLAFTGVLKAAGE